MEVSLVYNIILLSVYNIVVQYFYNYASFEVIVK